MSDIAPVDFAAPSDAPRAGLEPLSQPATEPLPVPPVVHVAPVEVEDEMPVPAQDLLERLAAEAARVEPEPEPADDPLELARIEAANCRVSRKRRFEGVTYGKGKRAANALPPFALELECYKRKGSSAKMEVETWEELRDYTYEWLADVAHKFLPAEDWERVSGGLAHMEHDAARHACIVKRHDMRWKEKECQLDKPLPWWLGGDVMTRREAIRGAQATRDTQ